MVAAEAAANGSSSMFCTHSRHLNSLEYKMIRNSTKSKYSKDHASAQWIIASMQAIPITVGDSSNSIFQASHIFQHS